MTSPTDSRPAVYGTYEKEHLNKVAFPLGGIGSGMVCVEGSGSFSQFSLRHRPQVDFEPIVFSAISVKGKPGKANVARVLEGPVLPWKLLCPGIGIGGMHKSWGLPRFQEATFSARFPFAEVRLHDSNVPLETSLTAWNPFIPNDADNSSLPVAGLEYCFSNPTKETVEAVFSFHAENFMKTGNPENDDSVTRTEHGFVLNQPPHAERPWDEGYFTAWMDEPETRVDPAWFRGGWFDSVTMMWKAVDGGELPDKPQFTEGKPSRGGSLYLPLRLEPGAKKTIVVKWAWYVPYSNVRSGQNNANYRPWYASEFSSVDIVRSYWAEKYADLRAKTNVFTDAFYDSTLPAEVIDAVSANLTILKSPTVLRQYDGRMWAWEGCNDQGGCCSGTCTHVWNYAQAVPHLFAELERGLRETEFFDSEDERGHQNFRAALPICACNHDFHAAADGQLGGVIKVYREWKISGDSEWLKKLWPRVKQSLAYCIEAWDPGHKGVTEEPHHNTYDIEFWGADGMCGSFYLGALAAAVEMGRALEDDVLLYQMLLAKGRAYLEEKLFNGEYFQQEVKWKGLRAPDPTVLKSVNLDYSPEAQGLLEQEGPKYQYGDGCLADGIIGAWMGWAAGLSPFVDTGKVSSHLASVFKYNFKEDLFEHANPQRSAYAIGHEAGLLLCTWPRGNRLSLPFVYSEEVWTGIEYQVASHLMSAGYVEEGLRIVRGVRARYDGRIRNPFNEFECGHWYARAMASYALLQGLSGARYDAVEKSLHLEPRVSGDFRSFLSTETGFGVVGVKDGKPFIDVRGGEIDVQKIEFRS